MGFSLKKLFKQSAHGFVQTMGGGFVRDSLGIGGGGGGGGGNAAKIDALAVRAQEQNAMGFARADVERRRSLGEVKGAYGNARTALGAGRTQGIQAVQDAGAVAGGQASQSLANRGLYNTTIMDNAQQGISAGQSRAVAGIEAEYARMNAELGIGEANAAAGIRSGIASGSQAFGQSQAGLLMGHAGLINSQVEQDPNEWLSSLLQIGGTALGYYIGGPVGGAAAGAAFSHGGNPTGQTGMNAMMQ